MNQCKNNRVPERRGEMESIEEFEPRDGWGSGENKHELSLCRGWACDV